MRRVVSRYMLLTPNGFTLVLQAQWHFTQAGLLLIFNVRRSGLSVTIDFLCSLRNLAIGIGIQNFPEGLAVSLPLRGSGVSTWKAFW